MVRRRIGAYSPLQILVRDHNWRIGNLRRLFHAPGLDSDLQDALRDTVAIQIAREHARHNHHLYIYHSKNVTLAAKDPMFVDAVAAIKRTTGKEWPKDF